MSIPDNDVREMVKGVMIKDLKIGVNATTLNKVFGKHFIPVFNVQLAESYSKQKPSSLKNKEVCITEKLDGFRIVYNPVQEKFFTRKGQEYDGLEHLIPELNDLCAAISDDNLVHGENVVIDGELVHEPVEGLNSQELYALTSSAARKKGKHKDKLKLQFHVFDFVPLNEFMSGLTTLRYKARRNIMDVAFVTLRNLKHVKPVTVFYMGKFDEDILMTHLKQVETLGGEGLMINLMEGAYECKRTKKLLKVKSFKDADVLVTDVVEGTGKNLGKLGNVVVKFLHEGREMTCEVGSGFNDEEREHYWNNPQELIGKVVEIKYFEVTQNQKDATKYSLRFPTWQGRIRNDKGVEDITDVDTV
jgi:DNA ligase-1